MPGNPENKTQQKKNEQEPKLDEKNLKDKKVDEKATKKTKAKVAEKEVPKTKKVNTYVDKTHFSVNKEEGLEGENLSDKQISMFETDLILNDKKSKPKKKPQK